MTCGVLSRLTGVFALAFICISLVTCGSPHPHLRPEGPYWRDSDDRDISEPSKRDPWLAWQTVERTLFNQAEQLADIERGTRILVGDREQAWNINTFDEVPDCSWFVNRHGLRPMAAEEIKAGVQTTGGPDVTGPWILFRPKAGGKTPGFWIEDPRGQQYIIKFDPTENPELATAAAAMASRYFHAAGYNVPEETIVYWRPDQLRIKDGLMFTDEDGVRRAFTPADLEDILSRVRHEADGLIRSVASLALPNVKGPFSYTGVRSDDPNDWCRHEHRRELRGLYVIASLVNHYDLKDQNSLDCYVEQDGRRFLRHYLIDFGSTFGSNGDRSKEPFVGYCSGFDLRDSFVSLVTFGLKTWAWERAEPCRYPSIGYFESNTFQPDEFDPIVPNPAFENMTHRDAYWGAKIVMAFRDEHLRALVETGQFSDSEAAEYLLTTLKERRDKIGRHWFSKVNPLDNFGARVSDSGLTMAFEDLAVKYGLDQTGSVKYRFEVHYRGKRVVAPQVVTETAVALSAQDLQTMAEAFEQRADGDPDKSTYRVDIRTQRDGGGWSKPVRLWLWYLPVGRQFNLVGIEHLD